MSITTGMIKELRDATSLGIADCKKALSKPAEILMQQLKFYVKRSCCSS